MSVRQYIGARYVPRFSDVNGGNWSSDYSYEALTIVKNGNDYYMSKIPVPIGVDITNTTYWIKTGDYNGAINNLQDQIDIIKGRCVSLNDFTTPQEGVEYAHDNGINLLILTDDIVLSKTVYLYDNMILDGQNHKVDCTGNFTGFRVFTNYNSGYWNGDNTSYSPYVNSLGINYNIEIRNIILGVFHRSNKDYSGTDTGANCKPRNWFAFDSIDGLHIHNIKSTDTVTESYVWLTQSRNVEIDHIDVNANWGSNPAGDIWIYTRFDVSTPTIESENYHIHDNILKCKVDEAIAIRSYNTGTFKNVIINDCFLNGSTGQGVTMDNDQSAYDCSVTIDSCIFYNCGARMSNNLTGLAVRNSKFFSDSGNVSNQAYFLRALIRPSYTSFYSKWTIENCYFDSCYNYSGSVYFEKIAYLKITDCSFTAVETNKDAIALGPVSNVDISGNEINGFTNAIALYYDGTDRLESGIIHGNTIMNGDKFIFVDYRIRYMSIMDNVLKYVRYGLYYKGEQARNFIFDHNVAYSAINMIILASGQIPDNQKSLIRNNVMYRDSGNVKDFISDSISALSKLVFDGNLVSIGYTNYVEYTP